jgi:hypothetical protein
MWPSRKKLAEELRAGLQNYSHNIRPLPGVAAPARLESLVLQIVASTRRIDYTNHILGRPVDPARMDPNSDLFDPERAAVAYARDGKVDEAVWLIFLATHVGKRSKDGWRRLRDIYSGLGEYTWTWARIAGDPSKFRDWLRLHRSSIGGGFGNHRKYESLDADSIQGTGQVVESYLEWIGPGRSHEQKFAGLVQAAGNDPETIFDAFYSDFQVRRFGRLGKFDFLALLGRLGLAPISPGSTYLDGATGPLRGARLLFGGSTSAPLGATDLDSWLQELGGELSVGMQVMEDSICNWQKSPDEFVHFKG